MKLSIVCVTQAAPRVMPFIAEIISLAHEVDAELVFGTHGARACMLLESAAHVEVSGEYLEEMLDPVLAACTGEYVLRLDDDERCSDLMVRWLKSENCRERESWFFPRFHMWPDAQHVITSEPYFPDFQGRLTTRDKASRPAALHSGSPWPSFRAPVHMEHHNLLVKTYEERRTLTAKYETIRTGVHMAPETVNVVWPEDAPAGAITIEPMGPNLMRRTYSKGWYREAVRANTR